MTKKDSQSIQTINAKLPYTSMQVFNTEHESWTHDIFKIANNS